MTGFCRFCETPLENIFIDLGMSPLSNAYLTIDKTKDEKFYPLRAYVCSHCLLVQLEQYESPTEIFSDYAYFSSYSESWLRHSRRYVDQIVDRFQIDSQSQVIEIASNDGYLLQYFQKRQIPVLGIEPAQNVADAAIARGVPTLVSFFGVQTAQTLAQQGKQADLLIGNNVLAHVPELNDFVAGMKLLLKPEGLITLEFPHLLQLIQNTQFDTIYHEHFSYFSLHTVQKIFATHNLRIFDVEQLPTHGGSLRIYCQHESATRPIHERVYQVVNQEKQAGITNIQTYLDFAKRVEKLKQDLLDLLQYIKCESGRVVGYGAPAKGNTLLNYCGIGVDLVEFTVDRNPYKQNKLLPGTHIPIYSPDKIVSEHPDFVLILPWNLKDEIITQMAVVREWGGKFIIPVPEVRVIS